MAKDKMNVAVLVSGGGTNLQALLDSKILKSGQIKLVISNNADAYALKRAENAGLPAVCVTKKSYKTAETCEAKMLEILQDYQIDVVVLAGFLSILSKDFIKSYENRIINIHPSLIPSFAEKAAMESKFMKKHSKKV